MNTSCTDRASPSTRRSSSSPTGPARRSTSRASLREDANVIDRLCRLALASYEAWRRAPDARSRASPTGAAPVPRSPTGRHDATGRHGARSVWRAVPRSTAHGSAMPIHRRPMTAARAHRRDAGLQRGRDPRVVGEDRRRRAARHAASRSSSSIVENGSTDGTARHRRRARRPSYAEVRVEHRADADYGRALRAGSARGAAATPSSTSTPTSSTSTSSPPPSRACSRPTAPRSSSARSVAVGATDDRAAVAQARDRGVQHGAARRVRAARLRHARHQGDAARRRRAVRPRVPFRSGPLRHRADPARRARRAAHRRDPRRASRAAARRGRRS